MKTKIITMTLIGCVAAVGSLLAQETTDQAVPGVIEEETVSFPTDVAPSELTPEQEKEAEKLLDESRAIYADILDDDDEGKVEYLRSNLLFVKERIAKTTKELKQKRAALAVLNQKVLKKRREINARKTDAKSKAKSRIQLVDEFRDQKESLTFRIEMLEKHLQALQKRQAEIKTDLANLGEMADPEPSEGEKAEAELDELLRKEQIKRFEKYNQK